MKVCFICEGSYPYVTNGVSSWIQTIVERFSDIEFSIWSIATSREEIGEIVYKMPSNITTHETVYLSDFIIKPKRKEVKLSKLDCEVLKSMVMDGYISNKQRCNDILDLIKRRRSNLEDIIMGRDFLNIVINIYNNGYSNTVFNDFLWNFRSMYFPLTTALSGNIPNADIYHAFGAGYAGFLGSVVSHINLKPFFITEHNVYTLQQEQENIRPNWIVGEFRQNWIEFFSRLAKLAYNKAEKVLPTSYKNKQAEIALWCPVEKIDIVPNGVDVSHIEGLASVDKLPKDTINIGSISKVIPSEDIKTMLSAFGVARRQVRNLALYIIGSIDEDREYYNQCLAMINVLSLENVFFVGCIDMSDIEQYLPDFDIMLQTSIFDAYALGIIQGMAAFLPQICTDGCVSSNELINGLSGDILGSAGFIVPVMETQEIADAIVNLSINGKLRRQMGEIGHERVKKSYQVEDSMQKYSDVWSSIGPGISNGASAVAEVGGDF